MVAADKEEVMLKGILLANDFDAFKYKGSGGVLEKPREMILEAARLTYGVEMRIAVFAAVISVIVFGISFLFHSSQTTEMAKNKLWAIRLVAIIIFIFGGGAVLIQMIHNAAM